MTGHYDSVPYRRLRQDLQQYDLSAPASSRESSPAVSADPSTPRDSSKTNLVAGHAGGENEEWRADTESDIARGSRGSLGYSEYRIRCLEANLRDPAVTETQKENMRVAIDMYRRNEGLPKWDGLVFIQGGKVVSGNDVDRENDYWALFNSLEPGEVFGDLYDGIPELGSSRGQLYEALTKVYV